MKYKAAEDWTHNKELLSPTECQRAFIAGIDWIMNQLPTEDEAIAESVSFPVTTSISFQQTFMKGVNYIKNKLAQCYNE